MKKKQPNKSQPGYISSKYLNKVIQNASYRLCREYASMSLPVLESFVNLDLQILQGKQVSLFEQCQYEENTVMKYKPGYKQQQIIINTKQQAIKLAQPILKQLNFQQYQKAEIRMFFSSQNYQQKIIFYHDFCYERQSSKEQDSQICLQNLLKPTTQPDFTLSTSVDPEISFNYDNISYSQYCKKFRIFIKQFIILIFPKSKKNIVIIYQFQESLNNIVIKINQQKQIQKYKQAMNLRQMLFEYITFNILYRLQMYEVKPLQCFYVAGKWCYTFTKSQQKYSQNANIKNQKGSIYGLNIYNLFQMAEMLNMTISELNQQNYIINHAKQIQIDGNSVIILNVKYSKQIKFKAATPLNIIQQLFKIIDLILKKYQNIQYICQIIPTKNQQNQIKIRSYQKFMEIDEKGSEQNMIQFVHLLFS